MEAQIVGILHEQESGSPTAEVYRKHAISSATFYKCKAPFEVGQCPIKGAETKS